MAANPEDFDARYGVRINAAAQKLFPTQQVAPVQAPAPQGMTLEQAQAALAGPQAAQAPVQQDKFPDWVTREQGTGPKLDRTRLEAIRDRYKVDKVDPWAVSQKGSDKDYLETMRAQFDQRANDWIEKYLSEGGGTGGAASATEGSGRKNSLGATITGILELIPAALKSAGDIPADLVDLAKYGFNEQVGRFAAAKAITEGKPLAEALRIHDAEQGRQRWSDKLSSGWRDVTKTLKEAATTDETLAAYRGFEERMNAQVPPTELIEYIIDNPSVANQIGGDLIGQLVTAVGTGGGSAAIKGTTLATKLAKGGKIAQYLGRALENVPTVAAVTASQTGRGLADLREQVQTAPLNTLLESENNKELYDFYRTQLGLPEDLAEKSFRETLLGRATDTTVASNVAAGAVSLGLGAPLERGAAGLLAPGLRPVAGSVPARLASRAGGALKGAGEEVIESLPQDIGQNVATGQITGQDVPLTQGLAQNAVVNALGGGVAGGVLRRSQRPEAAPAATSTETATGTEAPAGAPTPGTTEPGAPTQSTAPGTGLKEKAFTRAVQGIRNEAKLNIQDDPDLRKSFAGMQAPADILGGITTLIEEGDFAGDWSTMTAKQRHEAVEAAAGEVVGAIKNDAVKQDFLRVLREAGEKLNQPEQVTPPGTATNIQQPAQTQEAPEAPAAPTTPAAPVAEAPTKQPLRKAAETPKTEVKTKQSKLRKAAEEKEVITLPPKGEAPAAPTPAPKAETPVAPQGEPTLPPELSKAAPTYAAGDVRLEPRFESDIDRAAYGSTGKAGAQYRAWLKQGGFTDEGIDALREKIKSKLKLAALANKGHKNVAEGKSIPVTVTPQYNAPATQTATAAKAEEPAAPAKKPLRKSEAQKEAEAQDKATEATKKTAKPEEKKSKPLKKDKATIEAEKEAKAQDEATAATKKALRKPKGETKPPKQEAPASKPGQEAPAAPKTEAKPTTRETPEQAVARIAPDLESTDRTNIRDGIRTARESGDMTELNQALRDLGDTVDADTKKALREAARQTTPKEEGLTEAPKTAEAIPSFKTVRELWTHARENGWDGGDFIKGLRNTQGFTAADKFVLDKVEKALQGHMPKVRELTDWERYSLEREGSRGAAFYAASDHSIILGDAADVPPYAMVHELVHAATVSLLTVDSADPRIQSLQEDMEALRKHIRKQINGQPKEIKSKLLAYDKRLKNKGGPVSNTKELIAYGLTDPHFIGLLRKMTASPKAKTQGTNAWTQFKNIIASLFTPTTNKDFVSAFDELVELSARIFDETNTQEQKAAHLGIILGNIRRLPNEAMSATELDAAQLNNTPVQPSALNPGPVSNKTQPTKGTPIFLFDRLWEVFNNSKLGIERAMQEVARDPNGKVTDTNNPEFAARRSESWLNEQRAIDKREVVAPIESWLGKHMARFGEVDPDMFRKHLDQFLQNYHALHERNPTIWSEQVKLKDGKDVQRLLIQKKAKAGKITGEQMNRQLIDLAQKHAEEPLDSWASKHAARDPARARKILVDLAKKGYTTANLADLNDLLKNIRDRGREHNIESGDVSADDPYASRGWKWYVPLKGSLDTTEAAADYDFGASRGTAKAFRSGLKGVMQGRNTNADNVLEQLVVDMSIASARRADTKFKRELMPFILQNKKILGAQIRTWTGTPKTGYTTSQAWGRPVPGKPPKLIQARRKGKLTRSELPQPKDGYIYSKGDTHLEIRFPDDSLLMRGLTGSKRIVYPHDKAAQYGPAATLAANILGFTTNTMARLMTTVSPAWALATGFLRDTNGLPITVAASAFDTPVQATKFFGNYTKNLAVNLLSPAAVKNWGPEWAIISGDEATFAKYAKDPKNAGTFAARVWEYRQAGGSTEYAQGFNKEGANKTLFGALKAKHEKNPLKKGLTTAKAGVDKVAEVTGNWSQYLELKARVAAYDALKAEGKDEKTAAAIVKGALDFGQSGEWGKMINMVYAFYRVSATAADVLRRISTNKTGHFDVKKAASWGSFMMAMGYVQYMLVASMLGDDEEDKDEDGNPKSRMSKFDLNTLTQAILIPDGKGGVITYKIGLGLPQLLMAPGIIAAHAQNGAVSSDEAVKAMYEVFTRNYPAIQPGGQVEGSGLSGFINSWLQGLAPTAVAPFTQHSDNVTRFGSPIHTTFPQKGKLAVDSGMPDTAPEYKELAKDIYDAFGIDAYPETYRHFITQYGGQLSGQAVYWTIEKQNKEEQGLELPAARTALRLNVNDQDFYYRKESRKAMQTLQASSAQIKYHEENDEDGGKAWLRENPQATKRKAAATKLDSARDKYYKELNRIRNEKLLSVEGKRLARKRADAALREATNAAQAVIEDTEE